MPSIPDSSRRAVPSHPRLALAALLLVLSGRRAAGQEAGRLRMWRGTAQANASVLFGNNEQRVLGSSASVARADSLVEVRADLQALYGDATIGDGPRTVIKRIWLGTTTVDYRPHGRISPFVLGSVETNFEKQIGRRYSVGLGAKRTFVRSERTESSLSAAVLDERTVPRDSSVVLPTERLTRASLRGRIRHAFDDRVRVSHVMFWQPRIGDVRRYLASSTTDLQFRITPAVALSLSLIDNYDSEARRRGARRYNDGQLLFGLTASW